LASILASSPDLAVSFCLLFLFNPPTSPQIRQLAAVEMRKRVSQNSGDLWTQLPPNEREEIKAKLPELILSEPK